MASTETRIRCGHCKASHPTIEQVRSCATTLAARPTQPRGESFGQTLRRIDALPDLGPDADMHDYYEQRMEARKAALIAQPNAITGRTAEALVARAAAIAAKPRKPRKVRDEDLYLGDESGRCGRCAGTGMFITGTMNGKPVGPGGPCFRCAGKAYQTDCGEAAHAIRAQGIADGTMSTEACCDRVRNDLHDRYAPIRGM